MKSLLDIKPIHFHENSCIEDVVASICNWWNDNYVEENILLCYLNSWSFSYDIQIEGFQKTIGEKMSELKNDEFHEQLKRIMELS